MSEARPGCARGSDPRSRARSAHVASEIEPVAACAVAGTTAPVHERRGSGRRTRTARLGRRDAPAVEKGPRGSRSEMAMVKLDRQVPPRAAGAADAVKVKFRREPRQ